MPKSDRVGKENVVRFIFKRGESICGQKKSQDLRKCSAALLRGDGGRRRATEDFSDARPPEDGYQGEGDGGDPKSFLVRGLDANPDENEDTENADNRQDTKHGSAE